MQPKQTPEQHINGVVRVHQANLLALAHYARLLKACGVRQPHIFRTAVLP